MAGSILGAAVRRTEDPRFIRGEGRYLPNHHVDGALFLVPVRAQLAHGRIESIDGSRAARMPGVVGVFTADDLDLRPTAPGPGVDPLFARPPLATGTVRFVGEIVAVVVAESERAGVDAAGLVLADIVPLPVIVDPDVALSAGAPILFPEADTNLALEVAAERDAELFADAQVRVSARIHNQRLAAVPLETNSALAIPDGDRLHLWVGSQNVFGHRNVISRGISIDRNHIHALVPDMGGGFGAKFYAYPEQILTAKLALELATPVRWHESRRDNLISMTQGRAQRIDVELGAARDGVVTAMRLDILQDVGAYPLFGVYLQKWTRLMAPGVYAIPRVEATSRCVVTNTTPVHAYRGAGRPEATHVIERAMDLLAAELDMDPVALRRRNLIRPDRFPYTTPTGLEYDSGDYERTLDEALAITGHDQLREEQRRRRDAGDAVQLGIGVSCYVEITAPEGAQEWAAVAVDEDGAATVRVGTSGHGQGHETAFAQIVSGLTGITMGSITLLQADTDVILRGAGTGGSRSLQLGGSAVLEAGERVLAKAKRIVARRLEASPHDIVVFDDGRLGVAGVPDTGVGWKEIAALAAAGVGLDEGEPPDLSAELVFDQGHPTFPFGAHVSVVEVDTTTGEVKVRRHVAVDDCGAVLNPLLVAGQVHGGVAQGIGQALLEQVLHDEDGNPLTGNLTSYVIPSAATMPFIERGVTQTPTPHNAMGVKGIGESATIGSTPAVHNAVIDAISHLGIRHIDMPLTPYRVWQAIRER